MSKRYEESSKLIEANKKYLTILRLYSNISDNNMAEIVHKTSMLNINIDSIKTMPRTDEMIYELSVYVRDLEQLNKLILDLNKLSYIYNIERLMR